MGKRISLQAVGAVLLGLNVAIPMVLNAQGLFPNWPYQYHLLVGFLVFAGYMCWIIRSKQMQIDKSREVIRFTARPSSVAINFPDKTEKPLNPDEASITATIQFEIWADIDMHTARIILNVIGIQHRRWCRLVLSKSKRLFGINIEGNEYSIYRKQIKHTDAQPFEDYVTFKWRGRREYIDWGDDFRLELALEMGSPKGIWRATVDSKLYERGVTMAI
jgi:hypothetical protein